MHGPAESHRQSERIGKVDVYLYFSPGKGKKDFNNFLKELLLQGYRF